MLNKIWFALLAIGLIYGFGRAALQDPATIVPPDEPAPVAQAVDQAAESTAVDPGAAPAHDVTRVDAMATMGKKLTNAAIDSATTSVEICIGLIGVMALWLGVMKVAEDAGMVRLLARMLRPVLRWLFPDIPRDHPAGGAIVMNLAANILGVDNAATPLGLKAMKELQSLNPDKETATNSMAMFLAINTSSITLVAFTIIAYRKAAASIDPAGVITAMILATTCSTIVAITAAKALQRLYPLPMHSRGRACHTGGGPPEEGSGFGVHGPAEGSGFGVQGTGGKTEGDGGPLGSSGSQQSPGAEGE